jgi:hypothetical protein
MEHSGSKDRIHISMDTADLLSNTGKSHWFYLREDIFKGKIYQQTFWLKVAVKPNFTPIEYAGPSECEKEDEISPSEKCLQVVASLGVEESTISELYSFGATSQLVGKELLQFLSNRNAGNKQNEEN